MIKDFVSKRVSSIKFGFFSPDHIKKMASIKVVTPELYDNEGYPVDGGLMDLHLGVSDPGLRCKTCGSRMRECLGHFGYISLARPVIHISFVPVILSLLRHTCGECSRVLLPADKISESSSKFSAVEKAHGRDDLKKVLKSVITSSKSGGACSYCDVKKKKISLEKPTTFLEDNKKLSPIEVRSRLEKISDDDLKLFGIGENVRPEWLVLTMLPIPPVTVRPSITLETSERSEDDLTHKLIDIVKINHRLFENINAGVPEIIIEDNWELLQYHVTTYFDNGVSQAPTARHRSGQPLKTLSERIQKKEGRFRQNLVGKRTNFSARTVISPDSMIDMNEVGVPEVMAMKLTVPERVTKWNLDYLKKFVRAGPKVYPGANYVVRPDGRKKILSDETIESSLEELEPGYIVERHLMDGDVAVFNRQPSLHRTSLMCHKVRILPFNTFRINPAVCKPYNADFDGDEMNLFIPQTEDARAEVRYIMMVQNHLISPRYGLPNIGSSQDGLTGIFLLTSAEKISRRVAVDLLVGAGVFDIGSLPDKEFVSGRDVVSVLFPDDFDFIGKGKAGDVVIKGGVLVEGILDKGSLGSEVGVLLRRLDKLYSSDFAFDFLIKMFRLGLSFLMFRGFSSGIGDVDVSDDVVKGINKLFDRADKQVADLIGGFRNKEIRPLPGRSLKDTFEIKILEVLNKVRSDSGDLISDFASDDNSVVIMAKAGGAGGNINLAQMSGCLSQLSKKGGRINKGYFDRTLSCFERGDLGSNAHGFVRSSFRVGLKPDEYFFQSIVARDALMDKGLRTPTSGYLYRRLSNAMDDFKVEYDGTVRNSFGDIIQFKYGEDGVDVSRSEGGRINVDKIAEELLR